MSASDGAFVTPGMVLDFDGEIETGSGIGSSTRGWIALRPGRFIVSEGKADVISSGSTPRIPQIDEIIIGRVTRLHNKTAEIEILHIEGRDDADRTLDTFHRSADIFVSEIVDRFMPSPGDGMRTRDVIRARVIQSEPMVKASCKGNPALGVLHAICPVCGKFLSVSDKVADQNVACSRCDYTGYRALSNGYGQGHVLPDGVDFSELNRGGERWTPEMDGRLGHNGARPYLSPMADYRRGEDHEMPANQANRPVGRDGRPRREMHAANCTLCGTNTKVPFEPTPGKPIRCRNCMDKVKEGNASKEELAKERETINEMRKKAEKEAGVKLFVGGLPHESTEDELRAIVESHGEVRKVDIAKDNEGNSRGFGFVVFADPDEGRAAIKALNGTELGGRKLRFEESNSDSRRGRGGRGGRDRGNRGGRDRRKRN